jgi:hypothetical protein
MNQEITVVRGSKDQFVSVTIGDQHGTLRPSELDQRFVGHVGELLVVVNFTIHGPYLAYGGKAYALRRDRDRLSVYSAK